MTKTAINSAKNKRSYTFSLSIPIDWTHELVCLIQGGGADRDRTDDLKLAKLALYQLSYGPVNPGKQIKAHSKESGGPGRS
jgi:hypothetical protein